MGLRSTLATSAMSLARGFGNALGCEIAVDCSGHELETRMVPPKATKERAWDGDMYVKGGLFVDGYANPIRPKAVRNKEISESDEVAADGGSADVQQGEHYEIISSKRYASIVKNDLISQLINPAERLSTIQWVLIGMAGMMLMILVVLVAVAAQVGVF